MIVQYTYNIRRLPNCKLYGPLTVLRAFIIYGTIGSPSVVYSTLYMDHDMAILCTTRFGWSNYGHSGLSLWWKVRNWTSIPTFARELLKEWASWHEFTWDLAHPFPWWVHLLNLKLAEMLRVALKSDSKGAMPPSRLMPDTLPPNLIPLASDYCSDMSTPRSKLEVCCMF